jgi:hypothetical protein
LNLDPGHKQIGAEFDRFGIITTHIDGNGQHVYFDDLTYSIAVGILGDMDGDSNVDFDDIDDFVLGLTDPMAYENQFGVPPLAKGDTDGDGEFDFDDIVGFVALLTGAASETAHAVPEPSMFVLITAALASLVTARNAGIGMARGSRASPENNH